MTLADTSVWVHHFRRENATLRDLLNAGQVAMHEMVLGELACGNLPRRVLTLELLGNLPKVPSAPDGVVREIIEQRRLWGNGLGWIDVHLFVSARISGVTLWTLDKRLAILV